MTEYTPTTEDVRIWYAHDDLDYERLTEERYEKKFETNVAKFDRWLERHDSEVAQAERERISHLLKTVADAFLQSSEYKDGYLEAARHVLQNDWPIQYGGNK